MDSLQFLRMEISQTRAVIKTLLDYKKISPSSWEGTKNHELLAAYKAKLAAKLGELADFNREELA